MAGRVPKGHLHGKWQETEARDTVGLRLNSDRGLSRVQTAVAGSLAPTATEVDADGGAVD